MPNYKSSKAQAAQYIRNRVREMQEGKKQITDEVIQRLEAATRLEYGVSDKTTREIIGDLRLLGVL